MIEIHAEDWDTDDTDQTGYYGFFYSLMYGEGRNTDDRDQVDYNGLPDFLKYFLKHSPMILYLQSARELQK